MRARRAALVLAAFALASAGCQRPKGRCDASVDCASGERCDAGVCVRVHVPPVVGDGSGGGTDPTSFTPVAWSVLVTDPSASLAPVSVGADAASDDVLVAGVVEGRYDPWSLGTGGFAAHLSGDAGALLPPPVPFPTFTGGALRAVPLAGGGLLFAGRAEVRTLLGTYDIVPPSAGMLVLGQLGAGGDPVWIHTVAGTAAAFEIAPVAVASRGGDLVVAGAGAGDFGCLTGDTGGATFAAVLSGADGQCLWSRGFANRTVSDAEALATGEVALAGACTPTAASFDLGDGTTCARGMFVALLDAADGHTLWSRTSSGTGTVSAVRDVAVAPGGAVAVVGDARGSVAFGGATPVDFGTQDGSFVKIFTATGGAGPLIRPVEAPTAPLPDLVAFDRAAFDASARLWIAGRYYGQPTLAGVRFSSCRDACTLAAFLARVDSPLATPATGSFLPVRVADAAGGAAWVDDLVLAATTTSVSWALRFSGDATVGTTRWTTAAAGLGVVRIVP
jgi:hypothetical protein